MSAGEREGREVGGMKLPRVEARPAADGAMVIVCSGEFDLDTVGVLAQACDRDAADAPLLVLDVALVAFADSSFLNELIRLRNTRPVVLAGPLPTHLRRVLEKTGALELFEGCSGGGCPGRAPPPEGRTPASGCHPGHGSVTTAPPRTRSPSRRQGVDGFGVRITRPAQPVRYHRARGPRACQASGGIRWRRSAHACRTRPVPVVTTGRVLRALTRSRPRCRVPGFHGLYYGSGSGAAAGAEPADTLDGVDGGHEREADGSDPEPRFRHRETQQQPAHEQQGADGLQQFETRPGAQREVGSAQSAHDGDEAKGL